MTTVLLTLGRLPKALAIVRACRAAGCEVLIADPFRWHVCKPSRDVAKSFQVTAPNQSLASYLKELLDIVRQESVDIVIPVSEEALHVVKLRDQLPATVRLWAAPFSELAELHHKRDFVDLATRKGLPVPQTFTANEPEAQVLAQSCDYVEKPVHSCSGIGLRFAKAGYALESSSEGGWVEHGRLILSAGRQAGLQRRRGLRLPTRGGPSG